MPDRQHVDDLRDDGSSSKVSSAVVRARDVWSGFGISVMSVMRVMCSRGRGHLSLVKHASAATARSGIVGPARSTCGTA